MQVPRRLRGLKVGAITVMLAANFGLSIGNRLFAEHLHDRAYAHRFIQALAKPGSALKQAQAARAVELASQDGVGKGVGMYLHLRPSRVRFSPSDCHYTVFTRSPLPSLLMDGYQLCGSGFTAGDFHRVEQWAKSASVADPGLLKLDVPTPSK